MAPTLKAGDQVLVWLRRPRRPPRPGTAVLAALPGGRPLAVKRLVRVEPDGAVWLEGDNPAGSTDSRQLGPLPAGVLAGRVLLRVWPSPGLVISSYSGRRN